MKRFLLKGTLLLLTSLSMLNLAYRNTNYWQDENDVKKFSDLPHNIQLANIGASHGEGALKYDVVQNYVCGNLALANQRHEMSYHVLTEYIDHMAENAVLLITVDYPEITRVESNFTDMKAAYYRILGNAQIPNYSFAKDIYYNYLPIFSASYNIAKIIQDNPKDYTIYSKHNYYMKEDHLVRSCAERYMMWTSAVGEKGDEGFSYNQQALAKIIDLCLAHNIKPVLFTTPMSDILNEYFDNREGFFDTFYRFINEIQAKYPDVLYFDYSHDERFSPIHEYYLDANHLNAIAAEKFTRIVVSDLENAGLLEE